MSKNIFEPWCCIGDFNDIFEFDEKEGGRPKEKRKIDTFRSMVEECGLYNVSFQGQKFTLTGIREGEVIRERLDRALVNFEWLQVFPICQGFNLNAVGSDHSPIILWTKFLDKKGDRKFKFEANWAEELECADIVKEGWNIVCQGSYGFILARKLKNCRRVLINWCSRNKMENKVKIEDLLRKISVIQ